VITPAAAPALLDLDRAHVWHPYSAVVNPPPVFPVSHAEGVRIVLADGTSLIDGMSSWWSVIHGYNHPVLNDAIRDQLARMAHVMFGGLTHEPAVRLAQRLVEITPAALSTVFFSDSGSVAVEVALKMAIQYQAARGCPSRQKFLTVRGGYHGDTFGAMSVCDPVTGMHTLFSAVLPAQHFAPRPGCRFGGEWDDADIAETARLLARHRDELAAVIIEPIVQGAGGMWFYHAEYLRRLRALCDEHGLLLIADEIATGFGRTGRLFACEHADIEPDVLCLGKGLTGGYMTLAATLTTDEVARTISSGSPGVFMHGPTFMANALACSVALASIDLLLGQPWQLRIAEIEAELATGLAPCRTLPQVKDVRVLGAIGVVELHHEVDMRTIPHSFVARGVWVRPFGRLVYVMPAYVMNTADIEMLTRAIAEVVAGLPLP
jgi:adenosylmethionine---8-amino-7-oxononanoate aminotransferase